MTGNALVDAISEIAFEGNIIPWSWSKALRFPNGKPDLAAIYLLADIIYWYRRTEERDEATGELRGWRKRFKADLLQRSYQAFADQTGLTKRQVQEACTRLAKVYGVIRLVFRTIDTPTGRLANVLFIAPVPEKIRAITHQRERSHVQTGHLPRSNGTPVTSQCETNTEITTETSREEREGERTRAQDDLEMPVQEMAPQEMASQEVAPQEMPAQSYPVSPTKTWSHIKPPGHTVSSTLEAELKSKYPLLNYDDEMEKLKIYEFTKPWSDWDIATRWWFHRGEENRKGKATVGPGKDNGGHPRRDTTTSTDWRTREIARQHQAALDDYNTHLANQAAMDITTYEDITPYGPARLPGISGLVDRPGGMLLHRTPSAESRPAVFCRPPTL